MNQTNGIKLIESKWVKWKNCESNESSKSNELGTMHMLKAEYSLRQTAWLVYKKYNSVHTYIPVACLTVAWSFH